MTPPHPHPSDLHAGPPHEPGQEGEHDEEADHEHDASGEHEDGPRPRSPFGRRGAGLGRWKRETRIGIAALLSFVILVAALILNKTGRKTVAMAIPPAASGESTGARDETAKEKGTGTGTGTGEVTPAPETANAKGGNGPPPAPDPAPKDPVPPASTAGAAKPPAGTEVADASTTLPPTDSAPNPGLPPVGASAPPSRPPGDATLPMPPGTPATSTDPMPPATTTPEPPAATLPPEPATTPSDTLPLPPAVPETPMEPGTGTPAEPPPAASPGNPNLPVASAEPTPPPATPGDAATTASASPPAAAGSDLAPPVTQPIPPGPPTQSASPPLAERNTPPPAAESKPEATPAGAGAGAPPPETSSTTPVTSEKPQELPPLSATPPMIDPPPPEPKDDAPGKWIALPRLGKGKAGDEIAAVHEDRLPATEPDVGRAASVETQVEPAPHVVQRGENFWTISRLHYGSGRYYKSLWKANSQLVPAPDKLVVGMILRIPLPEALDRTLVEPARVNRASATSDALKARSSSRGARTESAVRRSSGTELALPIADPRHDRDPLPSDALDPAPEDRPQPERVRYKVRPSQTLRSIARDTLGDSKRAMEIFELNRDILKTPYDLVPGQVIELPDDAQLGPRRR